MTSKRSLTLGLSVLLMLGACTSPEPAKPPLPEIEIKAPSSLPNVLKTRLDQSPDRIRKQFMRGFERLAQNDEVRAEQVEAQIRERHGEIRGQMIGMILTADQNNDGDLNANELLSLAMNGKSGTYSRGSKKLPVTQGDRNGDGIFSADEIRHFADLFVDGDTVLTNWPELSIMAFDSNQDGVLTRAEIERELDVPAAKPLNTIPVGTLPAPEQSERREAQQALRDEVCRSQLSVPKNAEILLLSGYEGTALSTVTVTDQTRDTEVTQVIIEEGKRPLHIIAGTYTDMIWSIEGDTKRVSGFVARKSRASSGAGAGVMGLPAHKVDFIDSSCMRYFKTEKSQGGILAKSLFERIYERPIDRVVAKYGLDSVSLPSGVMKGEERRIVRREAEKTTGAKRTELANGISLSARDNFAAARQTDLYRFFEDGIAYVDASKVVSPTLLSNYGVYPDHAGIAQLIETGHLERLERGTYYIHKTFTNFPAGLGGSHSVKFILGKGVQRPGGSAGHSALIDEATGSCIGARCPRE